MSCIVVNISFSHDCYISQYVSIICICRLETLRTVASPYPLYWPFSCNVFRDLMRKPKMTMKMRGMKRRPEPSSIPTGSDNLCLQNAWDWASKGLMKPRRPLLRCFGACLSCRFRSYLHNFSLWVEKQLVALLYKISVLGLQIICAVPVLSVAESIDSLYCKHHSYSYMYLCTVQVEPFTAQLWWRARSIK